MCSDLASAYLNTLTHFLSDEEKYRSPSTVIMIWTKMLLNQFNCFILNVWREEGKKTKHNIHDCKFIERGLNRFQIILGKLSLEAIFFLIIYSVFVSILLSNPAVYKIQNSTLL